MNQDHVFLEMDKKSIAIVRTDYKAKVQATFSSVFSREDVFIDLAAEILAPFDSKYVVISHLYERNREVLKEKAGRELFPRAWIDTAQMAWPLVFNDIMNYSRTLESLCMHFDIPNDEPGVPEADVTALLKVYWEMMRRYRTALVGEQALHSVGGETLHGLRKLVGL